MAGRRAIEQASGVVLSNFKQANTHVATHRTRENTHTYTASNTDNISINARFSQQTRITLVAAITQQVMLVSRLADEKRTIKKINKKREKIERTILPSLVEIRAVVLLSFYLSRPASNQTIA